VAIGGGHIVTGIPGFNETDASDTILRGDVGAIRTYTAGDVPAVTAESLRAEVLAGTSGSEFGAKHSTTRTRARCLSAFPRKTRFTPTSMKDCTGGRLRRFQAGAGFGTDMDVSEKYLVIGAPGANLVYIYTPSPTGEGWDQQQPLTGTGCFRHVRRHRGKPQSS